MITIEDALRLAVEAHEGQKDLDGKPVILHPMAVASFLLILIGAVLTTGYCQYQCEKK